MEKTNTTIVEAQDKKRISRREWRKARRKAIRSKRAAAKKKVAEIKASEPKMYDVLIQFDTRCKNNIDEKFKKNKIKPDLITNTYAYMRGVTAEKRKELANLVDDCGITIKNKTYKIHVSANKAHALPEKERRTRKPTNNTDEAKQTARKARKDKNKAAAKAKHEYAQKRKAQKKACIVGRKAKLHYMIDKDKPKTVQHNRGGNLGTRLETKLKERAKKAGQYLIKKEKAKPLSVAKKAENKPSTKHKVVQQKLPLQAAA